MSETREAEIEERKRIHALMHKVNDWFNDLEIPTQDRINACLDLATELIVMGMKDRGQTREVWLKHCAIIFDETLVPQPVDA